MRLGEAIKRCKVRGYVYRTNKPDIKYYKNHSKTILERILKDYGHKGLYYKNYEHADPEQNAISIIG